MNKFRLFEKVKHIDIPGDFVVMSIFSEKIAFENIKERIRDGKVTIGYRILRAEKLVSALPIECSEHHLYKMIGCREEWEG